MYNRKVCFVAKRSYSIVQIFLNHVATIGQASDKVRVGIQMTRKRIIWFGTRTIIGFFFIVIATWRQKNVLLPSIR